MHSLARHFLNVIIPFFVYSVQRVTPILIENTRFRDVVLGKVFWTNWPDFIPLHTPNTQCSNDCRKENVFSCMRILLIT